MRGFEFASAGISVVFRGNDLFLSPELLAEFEDKYVGRVSERTMQAMLVIAQNVEALRLRAALQGSFGASFNTWTTFLPTEELAGRWKEVVKNSHVYMRRVRKLTGGCLVWVVEWGGRGGRVHGHFVSDRWMNRWQQAQAKGWRNSLMGRCHMTDLGAGGYLWKEMGKCVGRRGTGMRLMGHLGDFVGRCCLRDFVMDSPMARCRRLAWRERRRGELYRATWDRGREIYQAWLRGERSLGREYDRFRESCGGRDWRDADFKLVGDACEVPVGDVTFDVEELDSGKGGDV